MFKVYKRDLADVEPTEYLPAAEGETLSAGVAAVADGGRLAKAAAAQKPDFLVLGGARADGLYPAMRLLPTTVFETVSTAAVPETAVGSAVTLGTDAASVTAAAGGAFLVERTENKAGGRVFGRFVSPVQAAKENS